MPFATQENAIALLLGSVAAIAALASMGWAVVALLRVFDEAED